MANRQGRYTVAFDEPPAIAGFGAFVGKKEKDISSTSAWVGCDMIIAYFR